MLQAGSLSRVDDYSMMDLTRTPSENWMFQPSPCRDEFILSWHCRIHTPWPELHPNGQCFAMVCYVVAMFCQVLLLMCVICFAMLYSVFIMFCHVLLCFSASSSHSRAEDRSCCRNSSVKNILFVLSTSQDRGAEHEDAGEVKDEDASYTQVAQLYVNYLLSTMLYETGQ